MKKIYILLLAVAFIFPIGAMGAWVEPTVTPPQGNTYAPINVGPDTQQKVGSFDIGGILTAIIKIRSARFCLFNASPFSEDCTLAGAKTWKEAIEGSGAVLTGDNWWGRKGTSEDIENKNTGNVLIGGQVQIGGGGPGVNKILVSDATGIASWKVAAEVCGSSGPTPTADSHGCALSLGWAWCEAKTECILSSSEQCSAPVPVPPTDVIAPSPWDGVTTGYTGSWLSASTLPATRLDPAAVVSNGYVYAIGGQDNQVRDTVYFAKLNSNGSLGSWSSTTALPAARYSASAVAVNGYIYVVGGTDGFVSQSNVWYSKQNSDGSLGLWGISKIPAGGEINHFTVAANGYLYIVGGADRTGLNFAVHYAKLNSDGSLGIWTQRINKMPVARSSYTQVIANGYLYVISGSGYAVGVRYDPAVYYAKLNSDGSVGTWNATRSLPSGRWDASSVVSSGYLYVAGGEGEPGGTSQPSVFSAKLNSDGSLGSWQTVSSLSEARIYHSLVVANKYMYVIGGNYYAAVNFKPVVFYAPLR